MADNMSFDRLNMQTMEEVRAIGQVIANNETVFGARILNTPLCRNCKRKSHHFALERLSYDTKGNETACILCDKELDEISYIKPYDGWFKTPKESITDNIFIGFM